MDTIEAYPLTWPASQQRTPRSKVATARFGIIQPGRILDMLQHQVDLHHGRNLIVSSNMPVRRDGRPYAKRITIEDHGVAVYFERKGKPICIACDRWTPWYHNALAISKTLEAIRGIERWGSSNAIDQAFRGFEQLPEHASEESCWAILGIPPGSPEEAIKKAYRAKAYHVHPDKNPDAPSGAMAELNDAIDQALAQVS